ncbi:Tn3 family transposase [Nonomuraea deserti]|uniref:Tn3 family transposase n=1 Tax=Nonomuraea deserti TaxID=1848322 RepID=UPI0034E05ED0
MRQNAPAAALKEYGALRRTIYAARYLADPAYRRKISRQLYKGESPSRVAQQRSRASAGQQVGLPSAAAVADHRHPGHHPVGKLGRTGQHPVGGEQLVDLAADLDLAAVEHHQPVASVSQVGHHMGGQHDGHLRLGHGRHQGAHDVVPAAPALSRSARPIAGLISWSAWCDGCSGSLGRPLPARRGASPRTRSG